MAPNRGWQELQTPSRRECPKLFYNYLSTGDGLTLLVTDLMALWQCTLDKYDIIADAGRQHCPIDPSESTQQLKVLISKLEQSLEDGENVLASESDRKSQVLILRTRVDLPKPLRPLDWTFKLASQNASEMAEQILRPSLREVALSQHKVDSLNSVIKDKDHVISKLLDRISNSAIDISLIFPGITGLVSRKGHITVDEAMKHVAGMAPFDPKTWKKRFAEEGKEDEEERAGLEKLVSGCEKCFVHTRAEHEGWLSRLSNKAELKSPSSSRAASKRKETTPDPEPQVKSEDEATASEDDFERQATPPSARKNEKLSKGSKHTASASETESDDSPPPAKRAKTNKIGALGSRAQAKQKAKSQSPSPSPKKNNESTPTASTASGSPQTSSPTKDSKSPSPPHTRSSAQPTSKRGKLSSLSSTSRTTSSKSKSKSKSISPETTSPASNKSATPPPSHSSPPQTLPLTPSRRLGRIGAAKQSQRTKSPTPKDPHSQQEDEKPTPSRRLGRIGGRKTATESPASKPVTKSSTRDKSKHDENDTETESEDESTAPPSKRTCAHDNESQSPSPTPAAKTDTKSAGKTKAEEVKEDKIEEEEEETPEQRANRRREELKRNIAPSSSTRAATAGAAGKKKRRF